MSTVLTVDHPAWQAASPEAPPARLVRSGDGLWLTGWGLDGLTLACVEGAEDSKPNVVATHASGWAETVPADLAAGLSGLGTTLRLANPWLWDAVTTAILRQVIHASAARERYRTWCRTYGTGVDTEHGPRFVAPDPRRVLELTDGDFAAVKATFNQTALRAAATAYLQHGDAWSSLSAGPLAQELMSVPKIGPWTAAAAAADFTGDFAFYPHNDLAVRTWAVRIAPGHDWPPLKKGAFESYWRSLAGCADGALHTLTLTTLTWGAHARTDQHGGTTARP
ncbi:hypothetical protein [Kitasatospora sp. NPDC088548]|uniref:hypothetical protein n=1 Tax=Kitasatospora sp. NPDC088548 TaxID=3364075 RepID=UPI00381B2E97